MSDDAVIQDVLRRFVAAYETRDMSAMSELFAHDDSLVFLGTQANLHLFGWPALKDSLERQFAVVGHLRLEMYDMRVRMLGPRTRGPEGAPCAACVSLTLDFEGTISGDLIRLKGIRVTGDLERVDGNWRIIQMHWSLARPEVLVQH